MNDLSWIAHAVIYQINLRALAAREPRNPIEAFSETAPAESPLAYLTDHLDVFGSLGVTVLHLMPPFLMGIEKRKGIGSPYAARDYFSIDPEWGSLAEFRRWVQRAHALGFKVIVGMVPNHSSRDHRWVQEHPEYYVRNENGEALFDLDWSDTAKLDYTNPGLRAAMIEVYDFWLSPQPGDPDQSGVDGFRIDMAHFINDPGFWNQATAKLRQRHPDRELLFMAECYGTVKNIDLFQRGFNAAYDDLFYKLGQYFYGVDPEGRSRLIRTDPKAHYNEDFQAIAALRIQAGIAAAVRHALRAYDFYPAEAPTPRVARYVDNHDEGRGVYRFGSEASRVLMALAFLSERSMPFLLTGQEFGAANRPSIHERMQPCDKGCRVEMADGGERSKEGVEFEGNVYARSIQERQAWLAFFRELIALRKAETALISGRTEWLPTLPDDPEGNVLRFDRVLGNRRIRCLVNLSHMPQTMPQPEKYPILFSNTENPSDAPLHAFEIRVVSAG